MRSQKVVSNNGSNNANNMLAQCQLFREGRLVRLWPGVGSQDVLLLLREDSERSLGGGAVNDFMTR